MALVFGMTVVGCNNDSPDNNNDGTFTLTSIPWNVMCHTKYLRNAQERILTNEVIPYINTNILEENCG